jgi:hypothetical protein
MEKCVNFKKKADTKKNHFMREMFLSRIAAEITPERGWQSPWLAKPAARLSCMQAMQCAIAFHNITCLLS